MLRLLQTGGLNEEHAQEKKTMHTFTEANQSSISVKSMTDDAPELKLCVVRLLTDISESEMGKTCHLSTRSNYVSGEERPSSHASIRSG